MEFLHQKLKEYHQKNIYPFHMPGHKRNEDAVEFQPKLTEDITEIDGFDYLHRPTGILQESQAAAAELYKADETYYCVNGSTGALLAAIAACTVPGGSILMARNCHQSVYHGVCLSGVENYYVYPELLSSYDIHGAVMPEKVEAALSSHPRVQAVVITSPTYDGVVSSVGEIAEIVHRRGVPLIVDEAHGAHFPFHDYFPYSALEQGADVVVHSLHKTLPALTQTALLHVQGKLADRERIRRHMGMYQTSSPSYVLMASIDLCMEALKNHAQEMFAPYVRELGKARERLSGLQSLELLRTECYDISKLVIAAGDLGITGQELYERLLSEYHLQMEMAAGSYVLAMTSVSDTKEGLERLTNALFRIDNKISCKKERISLTGGALPRAKTVYSAAQTEQIVRSKEAVTAFVPWRDAAGYISAEYAYLYPPGCPLIVPGERVTEEAACLLQWYGERRFSIEGLKRENCIEVLVPH